MCNNVDVICTEGSIRGQLGYIWGTSTLGVLTVSWIITGEMYRQTSSWSGVTSTRIPCGPIVTSVLPLGCNHRQSVRHDPNGSRHGHRDVSTHQPLAAGDMRAVERALPSRTWAVPPDRSVWPVRLAFLLGVNAGVLRTAITRQSERDENHKRQQVACGLTPEGRSHRQLTTAGAEQRRC